MIDQSQYFALSLDQRENCFFQHYPVASLLKDILLSMSGTKVIWMPVEPHLSELVKNGQNFSVDKLRIIKGEQGRCHRNSAKLFMAGKGQITTGYALSDNIWRQHSWIMAPNHRIIETTMPFEKYYGVMLSEINITKFVFSELGNQVMQLPKEQLLRLPMPDNLADLVKEKTESVVR